MKTAEKTRDIGLDLTRIIAFLSVASVHFFLHSGFYYAPIAGKRMMLMVVLRTACMVCVPLFLILTGYLSSGREIALTGRGLRGFYSKLTRVVFIYVLSSALILCFRRYVLREAVTVSGGLFSILGYEHYSWYVEMYLGLYLLVPFLNAMWRAMGERRSRRALVIVLAVLTALPSLLNGFDFRTPGALARPWRSSGYNKLIPEWWTALYPLTYYFIGAYIRSDVQIKALKTRYLALALFCALAASGGFNIWRSYSVDFVWGDWCGWGGFENVVNSTLAFLLVNSIHYGNGGGKAGRLLGLLSRLTFAAYLLSWIPDHYFYPALEASGLAVQLRLNVFPVYVGRTVVISLALAFAVECVYLGAVKLASAIRRRR